MAFPSNKATTASGLASSGSFGGRFQYDVFSSFRGEDTRNNFTGLFHYILDLHGIRAYFDEQDLDKGEKIDKILQVMGRSRIFLPIFSKNCAESKRCLKEVAKMVECCFDGGHERRIIPVFFDVDPTNVRHQSGPFEDAFQKHEKEEGKREEVKGWKDALGYVGGLSGYDLMGSQYNGCCTPLSS